MTTSVVIDSGGILFGAVVAVLTLVFTVRAQSREQEEKVADAKKKFGDEQFALGVASRQDTIDRMQAQLADAWKDRDLARADATRWENRYLNLRDGQTQQDDRNRRDATDDREANQ